jgi:hypothetical protein
MDPFQTALFLFYGRKRGTAQSYEKSLRIKCDLIAETIESTGLLRLFVVYFSMMNEKKNTTNNTETVTISRAEYEALQAKLAGFA